MKPIFHGAFTSLVFLVLVSGCGGGGASSSATDGPLAESEGALATQAAPAFKGKYTLADNQSDDFLAIWFTDLDVKDDGSFSGTEAATVDGGDGNAEVGERDIANGRTKFVPSTHQGEGTVTFSYSIDGQPKKDLFLYKVDGRKVQLVYAPVVAMAVGKRAAPALMKKTFAEIVRAIGKDNAFTLVQSA